MNLTGMVSRRGVIGWTGGLDVAAALADTPYAHFITPQLTYVGEDDLTVHVMGNFKPGDKIVWNGGEEVTVHVSDSELTTLVSPSTASGPHRVPVQVKRGAKISRPVYFKFLDEALNPDPPAPPPPPEEGQSIFERRRV